MDYIRKDLILVGILLLLLAAIFVTLYILEANFGFLTRIGSGISL